MEAKLDNNKLLSRGREDKRGVFPNRSPGVFIRFFFFAHARFARATVLELKRSLEQTRRKEKKRKASCLLSLLLLFVGIVVIVAVVVIVVAAY